MKLQQQVVNLELSKKLKGLGFKQESYFHWYQGGGGEWYLGDTTEMMNNAIEISHLTAPQFNSYSAYTVAELGEMLSSYKYNWQNYKGSDGQWVLGDYILSLPPTKGITEADARAKMLIYLKENNLL